jgi:hypothetical protein
MGVEHHHIVTIQRGVPNQWAVHGKGPMTPRLLQEFSAEWAGQGTGARAGRAGGGGARRGAARREAARSGQRAGAAAAAAGARARRLQRAAGVGWVWGFAARRRRGRAWGGRAPGRARLCAGERGPPGGRRGPGALGAPPPGARGQRRLGARRRRDEGSRWGGAGGAGGARRALVGACAVRGTRVRNHTGVWDTWAWGSAIWLF